VIYTSLISLHKDVRDDLAAIRESDPAAHAKIAALIRQLRADSALAEKLLDHGFGDDRREDFSVNKWLGVWKEGKDLWRLKSWDMEYQDMKYRLIYLYLRKEARFVVMAIVDRKSFNYDDDQDPIRKRIYASLRHTYSIE